MLPHPQVVNSRYQLREVVGKGGMGIVYRADDRLTGETVALKQVTTPVNQLEFASLVTLGNQRNTQEVNLALAQEFRTLASLRHPNIISVLDYGFSDEAGGSAKPYYTMQLIQGAKPLDAYAAGLAEEEKLRLVIDALQALAYLHRRSIIHRDLSPANILVTPDGTVKVMDFGLAIQQSTAQEIAAEGIAGTVPYMAPEILSDQPPSIASDLYAIGMITYELLSGHHPFPTKSMASLISAIVFTVPDFTEFSPSLALVLEKLLAKQPYERYFSAEEVILALAEVLDIPIPAEDVILRESFLQAAQFVGRKTEFGQLTAALSSLSIPPETKTQGQAWLIAGESGVGKSRLLEELRIRAMVEGTIVLRGQGVAEGGLPYQLWREAVRRLILSTALNDLEAGILKEIVPDIGTLLGREVGDAPYLEGAPRQQRLVDTIGELFKRQTQPIVLILEDLQWAEESLTVLQHLLVFLENHRWLLIGSYRDDETPDLPNRLAGMQTLKLARLDQAAIADLSQSMLGVGGRHPQIVELLERESEGNAFFMVEVVRALAERAGRLSDVADMTLPRSIFAGGVQTIIQRRLSQVPSDVRAWLKLAAVAGRQLDLKVMQVLYTNPNQPTLGMDTWLTACANAAVLEVVEEVWRFSHDKIREALLTELTPAEKITLNRQVAEAIETSYPADESRALGLMEHWHAAGNAHKEATYAKTVAWQLALEGRNREALAMAERGLALPIEGLLQQALIKAKADALTGLGQSDDAEKYYLESLAMAEAADEGIAIVESLRGLGRVMNMIGRFTDAIQQHERSLALARELNYERGIVYNLVNLGHAQVRLEREAEARPYLETAEAMMLQMNDLRGLSSVYTNLAVVYTRMGDQEQSNAMDEKALRIARETGNRSSEAITLFNMGWKVHNTIRDLKGAEKYFLDSLVLFQATGELQMVGRVYNSLGIMYAEGQDIANARAYFAEAVRAGRRVGQPQNLCNYLGNLSQACYDLGDFAAAHTYAQEAVTIFEQTKNILSEMLPAYVQLAFAEVATGHFDLAYAHIQTSIRLCLERQSLLHVLEALVALAEWHIAQQRPTQAAELLGLVSVHPEFNDDLEHQRIQPAREKLKAALSADEIAAALERGKALDFDTIVQGVLAGPAN